jgi:hypothetical protein
VPEQDRSRLLLFVLGVAAVHALCLAAILPSLISLPGQGAGVTQDGIVKEDALVKDAVVDVEVLPSASTPLDSGSHASAYDVAPSLSPTPDPSEMTSALPDIPQNANTVPSNPVTAEPAAPVAAATPTAPDFIGNASPPPSPPVPVEGPGTISAADPASTNALPSEEAKPATTVALPTEKPDTVEEPSVKPRTTAAKTAKPRVRRQASVAKTQTRGLFGGFFQSQPRPKAQRATTSRP